MHIYSIVAKVHLITERGKEHDKAALMFGKGARKHGTKCIWKTTWLDIQSEGVSLQRLTMTTDYD